MKLRARYEENGMLETLKEQAQKQAERGEVLESHKTKLRAKKINEQYQQRVKADYQEEIRNNKFGDDDLAEFGKNLFK